MKPKLKKSERAYVTKASGMVANRMRALSSVSVCAVSLLLGGTALAQDAAADDARGFEANEIIVTATRHSSTIHDAPLSVSAITGDNLAGQGLKSAHDLSQVVAGLYLSPSNGGGNGGSVGQPSVAIRGIRASGGGAATTGIYINEVPLQQRNVSFTSPGGVVFPQVFDLERIEVLRGPQGTLYGGSSEGGTVRFITPQPNFTDYTVNAVAEGSQTEHGGMNGEGGLTVGGPLVVDKLAARATVWYRHEAGYIDHVSQYSGNLLPGGKNTNSANRFAFHAALAWRPLEDTLITVDYNYFSNKYHDSDNYWESIPQHTQLLGPGVPGTAYTYCNGVSMKCSFGPYKTGQNSNVGLNFYTSDAQLRPLLSPHRNSLSLPSLTIDQGFGGFDVKFIAAHARTINKAAPDFSYVDPTNVAIDFTGAPGPTWNALPSNTPYLAPLPEYGAVFASKGRLTDTTLELRATSSNPDARLTWVVGAFYDRTKMASAAVLTGNLGDAFAAGFLGYPSGAEATANGALCFGGFVPCESLNGGVFLEGNGFRETQKAVYGQFTFKITPEFRVTVGERVTWDKFDFARVQGGTLFGAVIPNSGSVKESASTPHFGLQYIVDPNLNLYANASKGFRPGGVNSGPPGNCLATPGFEPWPDTFSSDSLWSYEAGAKWTSSDRRVSANLAGFYIKWKNLQSNVTVGATGGPFGACVGSFTANAAEAVSQGANLELTVKPLSNLNITLNAAYTDAHYSRDLFGQGTSSSVLLIGKGDDLPYNSKWSGNIAAVYNMELAGHQAFLRADYNWQSSFKQTTGPGTSTYTPDAYKLPGIDSVNLRAGMEFGKLNVDLFVNNLTNSRDMFALIGNSFNPGRVGCLDTQCASYKRFAQGSMVSTFRPRTFGLSMRYSY